jgi:hypothetical protein
MLSLALSLHTNSSLFLQIFVNSSRVLRSTLYLLSLSLGCCEEQPTQVSTRETKPFNNEWWSANAHLHCRFSFEDVPEKKRKTVKILCRQDVLNLHRLMLFCGRFSQRLNMWLLLFATVLSWYLLLQRPAEEEEEECLRSFLMCFLCLRSDGIVVVVLLSAQKTMDFFISGWGGCIVCMCVCVFSFAHDACLRDVPGYSAKRE